MNTGKLYIPDNMPHSNFEKHDDFEEALIEAMSEKIKVDESATYTWTCGYVPTDGAQEDTR